MPCGPPSRRSLIASPASRPRAQRAGRFPAAAAPRPSDHYRRGALSRPQDPRAAHHPPVRSPPAWRSSDRRLDGPADPSSRPRHLRPLREDLPPEPAPLRLAQAQGTRPDRARRLALRLPALTQGRPSRPPLPLLPQAPVRPPRQQPLPSPAGPATPSRQPARSRLPPRRHRQIGAPIGGPATLTAQPQSNQLGYDVNYAGQGFPKGVTV